MEYAVAAMNFFDNELTIKVVNADNWKDAVLQHPQYKAPNDTPEDEKTQFPDNIEDAKEEAFNMDSMFDVIELEE